MLTSILYIVAFTIFTLLAFAGLVVIWLFTALLDPKRIVIQHYSRFWSRGIYKLCPWWKVNIEGLENIRKDQPYLILSNHQQMLDIPLLLHIPLNFRFVSKREVYRLPFFGAVLFFRDDVAIERGGAASAKKMIKDCQSYIRKDVSIAIFPEGTRTKTGEIGDFHTGAFLLAKISKTPILPVVINGNFDAFKGGKINRKHSFTVKILPEIEASVIEDMTLEEIKNYTEAIIKKEYKNLCQN